MELQWPEFCIMGTFQLYASTLMLLPGILYMYRVGTVATISCVHLSVKLIVVKYTNAQHLNENCLPLQGSAS